LFIDYLLIFHF